METERSTISDSKTLLTNQTEGQTAPTSYKDVKIMISGHDTHYTCFGSDSGMGVNNISFPKDNPPSPDVVFDFRHALEVGEEVCALFGIRVPSENVRVEVRNPSKDALKYSIHLEPRLWVAKEDKGMWPCYNLLGEDRAIARFFNAIHHGVVHTMGVFQCPAQPAWVTEGFPMLFSTVYIPIIYTFPPIGSENNAQELIRASRSQTAYLPPELLPIELRWFSSIVRQNHWTRVEDIAVPAPYGQSPLWYDGGSDNNRWYFERPGYLQAMVAAYLLVSELHRNGASMFDYCRVITKLYRECGGMSRVSANVNLWNQAMEEIGLGRDCANRFAKESEEYCRNLSYQHVLQLTLGALKEETWRRTLPSLQISLR